jgi:hypothetical protein
MVWIGTLAIIYLMLVIVLGLFCLMWEITKDLTGIGK